MTRATAIFLVCLRLAVGWHFAVEGWHKVHSQLIGPTETNRVFSSEGYFREAPGPLARLMRWQLGDPDDELLARLTVQPIPDGVDPAKYPAQNRMPPALARDWDDYLARFSAHYALDDQQRKLAEAKLDQMKHNVVVWLTLGESVGKKVLSGVEVEQKKSIAIRIDEYRAQVRNVRDTYEKKLPNFGRDVEKGNLTRSKMDLADARASLSADLGARTTEMKKVIADVLALHQVQELPEIVATTFGNLASGLGQGPIIASSTLVPGRTGAAVPDAPANWKLDWLNKGTAWGLLAIGVGLLVGLGTRIWCVLGAGFLLMTYLTAPPMPWWPTPPQQEGTYLFVNKNVVEMLALMVLATTRSGRWLGLDALIYGLWTGFRKEEGEAREH